MAYEIVCVDDEAGFLELYSIELEDCGYDIVTFDDPELALGYIVENQAKVLTIISDHKMPNMSGLELRKALVDKDVMIPFFMITAFYDKEMAASGMELKISKFISKPFEPGSIFDEIKGDLERHKGTIEEEKEMICSFVEESSPMIEEIEELILVLEKEPTNTDALNTYFRLLHTIKGTASCVGLKSLPEFTHNYEDFVTLLKDGKIEVTNAVIDILLKGLDVLKSMYTSIAAGEKFEFDVSIYKDIFDLKSSGSQVSKQSSDTEKKVDSKEVKKAKVEDEKLNVQISLLDEFMELSGEMTVLRNMVMKSVENIGGKYTGDRDVEVLADTLDEMHKVSSRLQGQISEMRKVNVDNIYRPLKRVVRDAGKKLNKDINFELYGEKNRVDTSIARVLNNVLVHLIRNGIDHGLETPDIREAAGKDVKGNLSVSIDIDVDDIVVEIQDDGNGMDKERLKAKALEKNLYTEQELNKMTDQRIYSLIFESGFSTAAEVTDISGRGVGMDMVRSEVQKVGGKIVIDSELGKGTKFVLVLPIPRSVLILKSLMVVSKGVQIAIPLQDVGEVITIDERKGAEAVRKLQGGFVLSHHDELVPLIDLSYQFRQVEQPANDILGKDIVVIRGEGYLYGIIVDTVLDIEEVVCKKMAKQLQGKDSIYQGATLIGDGEMALILDLEKMAERCKIDFVDAEDNYFNKNSTESTVDNEYLQFGVCSQDNYAVTLASVDRLEEFDSADVEFSGVVPVIRYRDNFLTLVDLSFIIGEREKFIFQDRERIKVVVVNGPTGKMGFVVNRINDIGIACEKVDTSIVANSFLTGTVFINGATINVVDSDYLIANYKEMYHGRVRIGHETSKSSTPDLELDEAA
jgi:two-component system chemotaxis sensor kinase CheA